MVEVSFDGIDWKKTEKEKDSVSLKLDHHSVVWSLCKKDELIPLVVGHILPVNFPFCVIFYGLWWMRGKCCLINRVRYTQYPLVVWGWLLGQDSPWLKKKLKTTSSKRTDYRVLLTCNQFTMKRLWKNCLNVMEQCSEEKHKDYIVAGQAIFIDNEYGKLE